MGDGLRRRDRGRRAHGEGEQQALVLVWPNSGPRLEPVEGGQDAEPGPRKTSGTTRSGLERRGPRSASPKRTRLETSASRSGRPGLSTLPETESGVGRATPQVDVEPAGGRRSPDVVALRQSDQERTRVDERAAALDDQLEHSVEIGLPAHGAGDRRRGLDLADGALELVALGPEVP